MNRLLISLVLGVLASGATAANAASLPTAKPEEVGLSSAALQRIGRALKADVDSGQLAGAVVVVARKGRIAYSTSLAFATRRRADAARRDLPHRVDD